MRIRRWIPRYSHIPIHWKLTIGSALLLFLLFAAYNVVQYVFVEKWMIRQEESSIQQDMRELLNYLLAKEYTIEEQNYETIRNYLEKVNERNQAIRILNEQGEPIIVVSDDMPDNWTGQTTVMRDSKFDNLKVHDSFLIMRRPLTIFQFDGSIEIIRSMDQFQKLINAFYRVMLICGIAAIIISGLGGRLLARQLIKPLQTMNETIRKVQQNGLQERMPVSGANDDITALYIKFNEMMEQVEQSFQQQKQFVEDASHELRTPVAIIEGHLALLQRWGKDNPAVLEESLQVSINELARLKGLVQELLTLTRVERLEVVEDAAIRPNQVLRRVVDNTGILQPTFHIELHSEESDNCAIAITEGHLEQIILILLDNAVKYSGHSKTIQIKIDNLDEYGVISVADKGIGVSKRELPYIWDRFYRVDKSRSGQHSSGSYGLGLSIAKRLTERYKGKLDIISKEREGTTVFVYIPLAQATSMNTTD